jgi:hypothetical protein
VLADETEIDYAALLDEIEEGVGAPVGAPDERVWRS